MGQTPVGGVLTGGGKGIHSSAAQLLRLARRAVPLHQRQQRRHPLSHPCTQRRDALTLQRFFKWKPDLASAEPYTLYPIHFNTASRGNPISHPQNPIPYTLQHCFKRKPDLASAELQS